MLKLKNMQNNNKSKILSISSCQKMYYIIINNYETVNDEYTNVND